MGDKPPTPSSISNTGLIDSVPSLSANGPLKFIRIIYMGQAQNSNTNESFPCPFNYYLTDVALREQFLGSIALREKIKISMALH